MGVVGANASDPRGQMNDDVWCCIGKGTAHVFSAAQIIVLTAGDENALAPTLAQFLHYPRPKKTRATGYHDARGRPIRHIPFSSAQPAWMYVQGHRSPRAASQVTRPAAFIRAPRLLAAGPPTHARLSVPR